MRHLRGYSVAFALKGVIDATSCSEPTAADEGDLYGTRVNRVAW